MPTAYEIEPPAAMGSAGTDPLAAPEDTVDALGPADSGRATILVVDDEPAIIDLVGEYLNIQGFRVVSATSGVEALARITAERPDAVLLDVRMPEMDGIETLRRIMALDRDAHVLMVSANDDVMLAKEAIALGAFDYILKPIDFGYLSRAIDHMTRPPGGVTRDQMAVTPTPLDSPPLAPYDLALAVCETTRLMSPATRRSIGTALERIALGLVREGPGGERRRLLRRLTDLRTLLRFAKDLGDITDDTHRCLESSIVRVRRGIGGS
jgi:CheY-like chemotaxis protein